MKEAGFTQGGFYNHFKSKDALVAEVMEKAMQDRADSPNAGSLDAQVALYLSAAHRDNVEAGCPLSGFAGDAPRLTDAARACYARGLATYLDRLERMVARKARRRRRRAAMRSRSSARWSARSCCRARSPAPIRRWLTRSRRRAETLTAGREDPGARV